MTTKQFSIIPTDRGIYVVIPEAHEEIKKGWVVFRRVWGRPFPDNEPAELREVIGIEERKNGNRNYVFKGGSTACITDCDPVVSTVGDKLAEGVPVLARHDGMGDLFIPYLSESDLRRAIDLAREYVDDMPPTQEDYDHETAFKKKFTPDQIVAQIKESKRATGCELEVEYSIQCNCAAKNYSIDTNCAERNHCNLTPKVGEDGTIEPIYFYYTPLAVTVDPLPEGATRRLVLYEDDTVYKEWSDEPKDHKLKEALSTARFLRDELGVEANIELVREALGPVAEIPAAIAKATRKSSTQRIISSEKIEF